MFVQNITENINHKPNIHITIKTKSRLEITWKKQMLGNLLHKCYLIPYIRIPTLKNISTSVIIIVSN